LRLEVLGIQGAHFLGLRIVLAEYGFKAGEVGAPILNHCGDQHANHLWRCNTIGLGNSLDRMNIGSSIATSIENIFFSAMIIYPTKRSPGPKAEAKADQQGEKKPAAMETLGNEVAADISGSLFGLICSAQVAPLDIRAKDFAAHFAIGQALDSRAALSRDLPFFDNPLIDSWRFYTQRTSQRGLSAEHFTRLTNSCLFHKAEHKAAPNGSSIGQARRRAISGLWLAA